MKYRRINHAKSTKFSLCLQMSVVANQDDNNFLKKGRFNLEIQFEESNGTPHLNMKKLSTNSPWDFEYVFETIDDY